MNDRFVCLMYHNVVESAGASAAAAPGARGLGADSESTGKQRLSPSITSYFTTTDEFTAHLDWLSASRRVLTVDDLGGVYGASACGRDLPPARRLHAGGHDDRAGGHDDRAGGRDDREGGAEDPGSAMPPAVLLTFDDGWAGTFELAAPILERRNLQAVVFITTALIGQPLFATAEQLRSAASRTLVLGSHTITHPFLNELSDRAIREELVESRRRLEDLLSRPVELLSIPNGAVDRRVIDIAREAGYSHVFTSSVHVNDADRGPWEIGRAAIRAGVCFDEFRRLASGDFRRAAWRRTWLEVPRRLLGPQTYRRLRARLIGQRSGELEMVDLVARGRTPALAESVHVTAVEPTHPTAVESTQTTAGGPTQTTTGAPLAGAASTMHH
jgi:peptidoglycan/xylan/chitin deacetylase (PgdA/CDA1 family)